MRNKEWNQIYPPLLQFFPHNLFLGFRKPDQQNFLHSAKSGQKMWRFPKIFSHHCYVENSTAPETEVDSVRHTHTFYSREKSPNCFHPLHKRSQFWSVLFQRPRSPWFTYAFSPLYISWSRIKQERGRRRGFFSILLTHKGSHREAYRDFQPSLKSSTGGAKGWSDYRFRAPPAYAVQLLTLHQHRANNQCRTANQI